MRIGVGTVCGLVLLCGDGCGSRRRFGAAGDHPGKACPVGGADRAGCHMPKVNVPNSPIEFHDHRIRIVAANGAYPE